MKRDPDLEAAIERLIAIERQDTMQAESCLKQAAFHSEFANGLRLALDVLCADE